VGQGSQGPDLSMPEHRSVVAQVARKFDVIQSVYEKRKNRDRGPALGAVIPRGGVGAELGVHKGHFTPTLMRELEPAQMYVVDPWYLLGARWEWAAGDKSTVNALRRVLNVLRTQLEAGVATIVIADDRTFLRGLEDSTLDWVYVDTSHEYQHTREELKLLLRKVKPGGIIAGDDWQSSESHRHHGVCRAVSESVTAGDLTLLFADDRSKQWVTQVPGSRVSVPDVSKAGQGDGAP
jgi:hypothetical protein